jgi:tubulin polyglutamylase TTLL1
MKKITINAVKATYLNLDDKKKEHNFELLGMDFMIDQNYKPWLI